MDAGPFGSRASDLLAAFVSALVCIVSAFVCFSVADVLINGALVCIRFALLRISLTFVCISVGVAAFVSATSSVSDQVRFRPVPYTAICVKPLVFQIGSVATMPVLYRGPINLKTAYCLSPSLQMKPTHEHRARCKKGVPSQKKLMIDGFSVCNGGASSSQWPGKQTPYVGFLGKGRLPRCGLLF